MLASLKTALPPIARRIAERQRPDPEGARRAPGPKVGFPYVGQLPLANQDRLRVLTRLALEHGDVVRLELPLITAHLVSHPDLVQQVLIDQHRLYTKQTRGYDTLRIFLGNGLVTSEGELWLRQRRIAQPAFARKRIAGFADVMVRATEDMCRRWDRYAQDGTPIDVSAEMMKLTLRIAGETLLSTDPSDRANAVSGALGVMLEESNRRLNSIWSPPLDWPTPRNRRLAVAMRTLDSIVLGIIDERRKALARGEPGRDDLLQMLLEAKDEETGERMTDKQLRDEAMTMFLAGHETTSNALAWTFYLLSCFPAVARAVHDEAGRVLGDRSASADDCGSLDLVRRVINESMRLYPPVWMLGRAPSEDVEIGGYHVPARSLVLMSQWVVHRHPAFWDEPEGFDPDRWLPERAKAQHRCQFFPFALGPRMCIGSGFAMMEAQLVLATVARGFRLDLVPGQRIVPEPLVTLRPKYGLFATVHRHDGSRASSRSAGAAARPSS